MKYPQFFFFSNLGHSVLHILCDGSIVVEDRLISPVEYQRLNTLLKLVLRNQYIDINLKNNNGNTPLSVCCHYGDEERISTLLKVQNINVNAKNNFGFNALSYAMFQMNYHRRFVTSLW